MFDSAQYHEWKTAFHTPLGHFEYNTITVIITLVDRFYKAVHFVPLSKLLTALETADLLVYNIVQLHRIPTDIISDRGPQFISQVWKALCRAVRASVSLS